MTCEETRVRSALSGILVVAVGGVIWQLAALRGDAGVTSGQVAGLHGEIAGLRDRVAATNDKIDSLRGEMTAQLATLTRTLDVIEQRLPKQ